MKNLLAIEVIKKAPELIINKWFYVSIAECIIILILLLLLFKKKKRKTEDIGIDEGVKSYKDTEIDLPNMFNSMFNASKLHDNLKKKIHPDRFPNDPDKIAIANELTAQLNESQNNIAKMKEIQTLATEKLGIKF